MPLVKLIYKKSNHLFPGHWWVISRAGGYEGQGSLEDDQYYYDDFSGLRPYQVFFSLPNFDIFEAIAL